MSRRGSEPTDIAGREPPTRVERSPADLLRLVVAAVAVVVLTVVEWLFGDTLVAFASDLLRGLDAIPHWIVDVVVIGTRILAVVVLGGGIVLAVVKRRWRMLVTAGIAGPAAATIAILPGGQAAKDTGHIRTGLHGDRS